MQLKLADLEKHLSTNGCSKQREGGNHTIWKNRNGKISSVPRHREVKNTTVISICKQLEIPKPIHF